MNLIGRTSYFHCLLLKSNHLYLLNGFSAVQSQNGSFRQREHCAVKCCCAITGWGSGERLFQHKWIQWASRKRRMFDKQTKKKNVDGACGGRMKLIKAKLSVTAGADSPWQLQFENYGRLPRDGELERAAATPTLPYKVNRNLLRQALDVLYLGEGCSGLLRMRFLAVGDNRRNKSTNTVCWRRWCKQIRLDSPFLCVCVWKS